MGSDVAEAVQVQKNFFAPKVHEAICCELMKVSEKVVSILPAIESTRPGSSSGIQVLCLLNNAIEKAKLIVHYCAESSKMYLVITAHTIASRCERIQTQLNQSLQEVQSMVPPPLASKIANVLEYINNVKFVIDPREEEAGNALLNLLAQTESTEEQEFKALQIAASRLNFITSIGLLVERRSIKRLLDRFHNVDSKKEKILKYFLYLINKYAKHLKQDGRESQENVDCLVANQEPDNAAGIQSEPSNGDILPKEYCCPISGRLMYDPVVISSGQTYERKWIQKWFEEGQDTCPKTHKKLTNFSLIPNSCMRDLISNWCKTHGVTIQNPCDGVVALESWQSTDSNSVSSLKNISTALLDGTMGSHLLDESELDNAPWTSCVDTIRASGDARDEPFAWSEDYKRFRSFSHFSRETYLRFLSELSVLPAALQERAVEGMKNLLEGDECDVLFNGFAEALILFMKKACRFCDVQVQRSGVQLLLSLVTNERWEFTSLKEDFCQLLASLLDVGIYKETLMILKKLVHQPAFASHVASSNIPLALRRLLSFEDGECSAPAVEILSELSLDGGMRSHFLSSGCIEKLGQLLNDPRLAAHCLNILQNLVEDEECSRAIVDADGCISALAEVLETGSHEEQEQAVAILFSLCSQSSRICLVVLKEGVIPSLVDISVNGNAKGKESSSKLLHVLREIRHNRPLEYPQPDAEPVGDLVEHPSENPKKLLPKYKHFGVFSRKMKHISKSLGLF